MKRLFWERLAWLWILCIPLAVAGGIGYGGQAYNPQSVAITGGSINNVPIGQTTPRNGAFITLGASSTVSGKGFSDYLASPPTIGGTASGVGNFSTMNTPNAVITGGSINNVPIGQTTPRNGAFITLGASSTVSGKGFSDYLASPPTIGGTASGVGNFSTMNTPNAVITGGTINIANSTNGSGIIGNNSSTGYGGAFDKLNTTDHYDLNGNILFSSTAPTIASGFGTAATIRASNGSSSFQINIGGGGSASSGVITMPAAPVGWNCLAAGINSESSLTVTLVNPTSPTSITLLSYNPTGTGISLAWPQNTIYNVHCYAY